MGNRVSKVEKRKKERKENIDHYKKKEDSNVTSRKKDI